MEPPDLKSIWAAVFGAAYVAARAAHAEPWHARNVARATANEAVAGLAGCTGADERIDAARDEVGR